jgi:hypothetical protein
MTAPARPRETILSYCARQSLAKELALEPADLEYIGMMTGLGCLLVLFTVDKVGDRLHGTTRSIKVPYE